MDKTAFKLELGRRISDERRKKKLLAEKVAEAAGITAQAYSNIECGRVECKSSTLKGICTALGVSADYLLGVEKQGLPDDVLILLSKLTPDEKLLVEQLIRNLMATYHK